ncbi:hypothetical protein AJ79_03591 [Helicocarpus griseus UAMH5409]|uniref:Uncharacterized protein n=1 Tax=Helicocarpus griseus UAMH5409 TaxID=1447875 RepID=A0A2B7XYF3_9EURO|nr:hypothetical protein AJ79_03591 [Helicocarpus griseus UAMH5409]
MAGQADRDEDGYLLDVAQGGFDSSNDGGHGHVKDLSRSQTYHILMEGDALQSISSGPRKRPLVSLYLIFPYSILLLLSWVITVILSIKPLNAAYWDTTYTAPHIRPCHYSDGNWAIGFACLGNSNLLKQSELAVNDRWRQAMRLIGALMAVLSIPISSAICARAAVAYLQNKKSSTFKLSEAITLADRGWWDPIVASALLHPRHRHLHSSKFLLIATSVCALGATIWPLQAIFVNEATVPLVLRNDVGPSTRDTLTYDADISGLSQVNSTQIISATTAAINTGTYWDSQPNIWRAPDSKCNGTSQHIAWSRSCRITGDLNGNLVRESTYKLLGESSFVSNVVNTANTGLFQSHSFRFNSSVHCTNVTEDMFPRPCNGFSSSTSINSTDTNRRGFEICAPGDMHRFPWNMTRDRQDIEEEVFLQFNGPAMSFLSEGMNNSSYTQRCTAQTTAGYSMLPNYKNANLGPLLDKFNLSASYDLRMVFQTDGVLGSGYLPPDKTLGEAYPIPDTSKTPALGPLLTATISLFGTSSFFAIRANATSNSTSNPSTDNCTDPVPFHYISRTGTTPYLVDHIPQPACVADDPSNYHEDLNSWLSNLFLNPSQTEVMFSQAVFYANKATISRAAAVQKYRRMILTDPGVQAKVLRISTAAIVGISVVMFLHLAGLVALAYSASKLPTWTETLNAFAVLKLGLLLKTSHVQGSPVRKSR